MHRGRFIIAFMLALGAGQVHAQDQAQDPAERGRALLQDNCSRCHAIGKVDVSALKAAPPFRVIGQSFDLDEFARYLTRGVASSHPDMPEFRFDEEDAAAVVSYLRTIQE